MAESSWSSAVKNEIASVEVRKQCCRRAEVFGLLLSTAPSEDGTVSLSVPAGMVSDLAAHLVREQFTREPVISARGLRHLLTFDSRAARIMCEKRGDFAEYLKCPDCSSALLRGAFLSCGSINAPEKENYLQIAPHGYEACVAVKEAAERIGISFCASVRRGKHYLYMKKRQTIEDLLALLGARSEYFNYLNSGIGKLARGDANRTANCITSNIARSVAAAERQAELIEKAAGSGALVALPPELIETASLRLENPSLSLAALGALHNPPVSKSGVCHRLERITELLSEKLK